MSVTTRQERGESGGDGDKVTVGPGQRQHPVGSPEKDTCPQTAEQESSYSLRKRIREERIKNTQEKIKNMKERQRNSEIWKHRQSHFPLIGIGVAAVVIGVGFYLFYLK